jgi:hypothetical protein
MLGVDRVTQTMAYDFPRNTSTRIVVSISRSSLGIAPGFQGVAELRDELDRVADVLAISPYTRGGIDIRIRHACPGFASLHRFLAQHDNFDLLGGTESGTVSSRRWSLVTVPFNFAAIIWFTALYTTIWTPG